MKCKDFWKRLAEILFSSTERDDNVKLQDRTLQGIVNYAYLKLISLPDSRLVLEESDLVEILGISEQELNAIVDKLNYEIQQGYFALLNVSALNKVDLSTIKTTRFYSNKSLPIKKGKAYLFDYYCCFLLRVYLCEHLREETSFFNLIEILDAVLLVIKYNS